MEEKKIMDLKETELRDFSDKELKIIMNGLHVIRTMHEQSDVYVGKTI